MCVVDGRLSASSRRQAAVHFGCCGSDDGRDVVPNVRGEGNGFGRGGVGTTAMGASTAIARWRWGRCGSVPGVRGLCR
eukprot:12908113-Prorocentrum_lima.AAC.1